MYIVYCLLTVKSSVIARPGLAVGDNRRAASIVVFFESVTGIADEIATYFDPHNNDPLKKLYLDGDGESLAMTDGLLMLRAMLGLSGDALTAGATGRPSAAYPTLRSAQQILLWIESTHAVACLP